MRRKLRGAAAGILALAALAPRPAAAHCHIQYQVVGPGGLFYQVGLGVFSYLGVLPGGTTAQLGPTISWNDIRELELYGNVPVTMTVTDLTGSVTCTSVNMNVDGPPSCTDDTVPEGFPPCTPTFTVTQTGTNSYSCASSCPSYPQTHVQPVAFDTPPASPAPALSTLSSNTTLPQSPAMAIGISGSGFVGASQVQWSGTPLTTVFVDGSDLLALVPSSMFMAPGLASVAVLNPGGASGPLAFAVASTTTASGAPAFSARVYPNPWRAALGSPGVTFDGLPPGVGIRIFSLSGRLVKTLNSGGGSVVWDLTNGSGQAAASGYYLYLISDGSGGVQRGRLALLR